MCINRRTSLVQSLERWSLGENQSSGSLQAMDILLHVPLQPNSLQFLHGVSEQFSLLSLQGGDLLLVLFGVFAWSFLSQSVHFRQRVLSQVQKNLVILGGCGDTGGVNGHVLVDSGNVLEMSRS
ncbi:hypothetical protein WICPIJ_003144 [Wickerhamomyces pijperi]|uniref:Uncharacterized protein n=1 Tax=Wickerhamomyces pijperi TaxID=599730 RepID=A0A9P8Q8E2_WICPI|nr:hypothetical protein WICPIJ_003144 [Wickerhamomyces pijperi]